MKKRLLLSALLISLTQFVVADPEPKVYFIEPADGAELLSPLTIKFGLSGLGVAPAGIQRKNTGHHHLVIDANLPDLTKPIPADDNHKHFGGGQTETQIKLSPGKHTLQLLVGDHMHTPHKKAVFSDKISITVK